MSTTPIVDRRGRAVLAACALVLVLACVGRFRADAPVQGWWAEHGPVVPHDTFPADCSLCHTGEGWTDIRSDFAYDHLAETGVELLGAHAAAQCLRCHNDRGPVRAFALQGCAGCHTDVHRGTLGRDCENCHDQASWLPDDAIAQHARTRFPLVGAHAAAACWRCHPGGASGNFLPVATECLACHAADLALALNPDHAQQGWVDDCQDCHIPTTWTGGGFTHGNWPLTCAHAAADCTACHTTGVFAPLPNQCEDCHLPEYQATTDPDHAAMGFPTDCAQCHGTCDWDDAQFNHAGITTGCVTCHLADYLGTTDPDHEAQGYAQTCEDCHDTASWEGAQFNHAGIARGCADCHLDDYLATSDPNHQAAGFPTACELCHQTFSTWDDADFGHTFEISSGPHSPLECSDCHLDPRAYSVASCTHCHEHSLRETTSEHRDVRGFVWSSPACIECHPTGD